MSDDGLANTDSSCKNCCIEEKMGQWLIQSKAMPFAEVQPKVVQESLEEQATVLRYLSKSRAISILFNHANA